MSTARPAEDIDQWIEFCESLSPIQNFLLIGLIGLMSKNRYPNLSIIQTQPIETEDNWTAAKDWALEHMRRGLRIYCENYQKTEVELGAELVKRGTDFVKTLAPFLVFQLNIPLGSAVAFLCWGIGFGLKKWCQRYSAQKFSGEGYYQGHLLQGTVTAFFDITYLPPIYEFVEDEGAYPLIIREKRIHIPGETTGLVRVPTGKEVAEITYTFRAEDRNCFEFKDSNTSTLVCSYIKNILPNPKVGVNVLELFAQDLYFGSLASYQQAGGEKQRMIYYCEVCAVKLGLFERLKSRTRCKLHR